ncbi:MAG: hypothetical protein AAF533_05665 [Acidobacteriota bacterium]
MSSESGKSKLKQGCGCGCLAIVVLKIVALVGMGSWWGSFRDDFELAVESGDELTVRDETLGAYVPPLDGRLTTERLDVFLTVRRDLHPPMQRLSECFSRLEELDGNEQQRPGIVLEVLSTARVLPERMGQVIDARNRLLLEHGMSLDEFTWMTYVAYWAEPDLFVPEEKQQRHRGLDMGPRRDLRRLFRAQVEQADTDASLSESWTSALAVELRRLEENPTKTPWEGAVPTPVRESLAPHAAELGELFLPFVEDFELGQVERDGIGYRHR